MQLRKKWLKLISAALLTVLLSCLLSAVFWPEKTSQFIGYRFYTVLTAVSYTHLDVYKRQQYGNGIWS